LDKLSNVGWKIVLFLAANLAVNVVQAKSLCFTLAETYYQQLYCEIKASGKAQGLLHFDDFRRNELLMQTLLLKQYASRLGINVVLPDTTKID
jgi:hypothetical protein